MSKIVGEIVTDKLSGKKGIVVEKIKRGKHKGMYVVRCWVLEQSNWMVMECPRSQFEIGHEEKKMGFK